MVNQFSRTELLIGHDKVETLNSKRVAVFGVGGVGGFVVEALVRAGIGNIDIIDNDKVSLTNINRQIIATHSTVGQDKVDVMENRIHDINPSCNVKCYKTFVLKDNLDQFEFDKYDYVVDAVDTVTAKIAIIEKCVEKNIPIISSMGTGNKLNPELLEISDISKTSVCPLAKVMRRELRNRGIKHLNVVYSKEEPITPNVSEEETSKRAVPGSVSFVPSVAGLLLASKVINDIIK